VDAVRLFDEFVVDDQVGAQSGAVGVGAEVLDHGLVLLPVAVDSSVALLDGGGRLGDVVVEEVVAGVVQVDPFAGHIGGDQQAHFFVLSSEAVDDGHLFVVGQAAVEAVDVLGGEAQSLGEVLGEAGEGGLAFHEDDGAQVSARSDSDLVEGVPEGLHFRGDVGLELFEAVVDLVEEVQVRDRVVGEGALGGAFEEFASSLFDGLEACVGAGEERLEEGEAEEVGAPGSSGDDGLERGVVEGFEELGFVRSEGEA